MLQAVIDRLKDQVPPPDLRVVEGAAEFAAITDRGAPQAPQAFVVPLREAAGDNRLIGAVAHTVREEIGVVLAFRHVGDPLGVGATVALETLRGSVRAALLGWAPTSYTPFEYVGAQLLATSDGIVWWQMVFRTEFEARAT